MFHPWGIFSNSKYQCKKLVKMILAGLVHSWEEKELNILVEIVLWKKRCCIVGPVQWTHSPHSPHVLQTEWRAKRLQHATAALQLFRPLIGQCRVNPGFWLAQISPSQFPPPTKDAFVQFQKSSVSNVNIYNISAHFIYWALKNWKTQKRNQISYLRFKKNNLESKTKRFSYSFLFIPCS